MTPGGPLAPFGCVVTNTSPKWSVSDVAMAASRAKARCAEAAHVICREAIKLHGAIGFTDEYDAGLYLKRAMTLSAWLGNAALHRRRYAELTVVDAG